MRLPVIFTREATEAGKPLSLFTFLVQPVLSVNMYAFQMRISTTIAPFGRSI